MAQGTTKGVPIDVDSALTANSDLLVPSQKAIKTYVDSADSSIQTQLNGKQATVTLTTTGTSGAATFNSGTGALNIPQYSGGASQTLLQKAALGYEYYNDFFNYFWDICLLFIRWFQYFNSF